MGTAIVAIPSADDPVWELSSEKIPHMTLLFLGEHVTEDQLSKIRPFVQHVSENSRRFKARVRDRGILGPEKADVLYFEPEDVYVMRHARDALLSNRSIREAYRSTPQFETWTPHLTMGYPESPAKKTDGVYQVSFDRIALWTGDSEGDQFALMDAFSSEESVRHSVDAALKHYGVKGMRWGVRRNRSSSTSTSTTSDSSSPDYVKARAALAKKPSELSNDEMRDLVSRLNLEKQYQTALAASTPATPPSVASRGAHYVGGVLKEIGNIEVARVARAAAAVTVESALKGETKQLSGKEFAKVVGNRITPKEKKKK
jgi:2'-5' RNA ligase